MKKIFSTLILLLCAAIGFSQSGFVSIGSDFTDPSGASVSFTYGQVFASFVDSPSVGNITEGVQQPYLIIVGLTLLRQ